MRKAGNRLLLAAAAALAVLLPGPASAAASEWEYVPVADPEDPPAFSYWLTDVAGAPAGEAWAVGGFHEDRVGIVADRPLVEHWNGTRWSVSPFPGLGMPARLNAVDVVSPGKVWTVGRVEHPGRSEPYVPAHEEPLVGRYDGIRWSPEPVARPASGAGWLDDVHMHSAALGWAVGSQYQHPGSEVFPNYRTLVMRWNGSRWSAVAAPNPGREANHLLAVSGTSATDVWAVGKYSDEEVYPVWKTLVLHWDGSTWRRVPSPNLGAVSVLTAVDARTPDDVWAVGYSHPEGENGYTQRWPIALRWNGQTWQSVPTPSGIGLQFTGVTALSANNAWVVGYDGDGWQMAAERILIAHWDGTRLTVSPTPDPIRPLSEVGTALNAVAVAGPKVWTVGFSFGGGEDPTPIMLRNDAG